MDQIIKVQGDMEAVVVSSRFRVTIPQRIRRSLGLRPGDKLQIVLYDGRIELIPLKPAREIRGLLKGIDTTIERERD